MNIIEEELNIVKNNLLKNFLDPFPNKDLENFISKNSKFIRSATAILYLKSQEKELDKDIYNILSAGELIHSASLLHDDVIDNADTRRCEKTFAKKFNSKTAILAGDFLLSQAIEKLLALDLSEAIVNFKNCTKEMSKAEIKQYFLRGEKTSVENYLEICEGKTATLFSTILETSAIFAKLPKSDANLFGKLFGITFQIKNDLNSSSAEIDKINEIYTAKDILGIEKTAHLLDNYKEEMRKLIKDFPENIYKKRLKDLINSL